MIVSGGPWQSMHNAPQKEGVEIIVADRNFQNVTRYVWREKPVSVAGVGWLPVEIGWHSVPSLTVIRRGRELDERYLWVPAPWSAKALSS